MDSICEMCELEHDGKYATGRFCSKKCASGFSTKHNRIEVNQRVSDTWGLKEYRGRSITELNEQIISSISKVDSVRGLSVKLDIGFGALKKMLSRLGLSIYNQGGKGRRKVDIDDLLVLGKKGDVKRGVYIKTRLIESGLKKYSCEECKNNGIWNGKELGLELDHINGNYWDNRIGNLRILCPNCHSQTNTFRNKKRNIISACGEIGSTRSA